MPVIKEPALRLVTHQTIVSVRASTVETGGIALKANSLVGKAGVVVLWTLVNAGFVVVVKWICTTEFTFVDD